MKNPGKNEYYKYCNISFAYDGRVSDKRFRIPRKNDAEVHAKTKAPIQAALSCAAWAVVSIITAYAAPRLLSTLELQ